MEVLLCVCVCVCAHTHTHTCILCPLTSHINEKWKGCDTMSYFDSLISRCVQSIDQVKAEMWELNFPQNIVLRHKPYTQFCELETLPPCVNHLGFITP